MTIDAIRATEPRYDRPARDQRPAAPRYWREGFMMRRAAATLLLLCAACANDPPGQSRTTAVAASIAPKTLVTTSAADIDPAPGFRMYTTTEGITFAIPPGFEFKRYYGEAVLTNGHGAEISISWVPLCDRPLTELCSNGGPGWTREVTASTCFETGRRGNTIEWERERAAGEGLYYLHVVYPASELAQFDDIIARVYRSWKLPDPPTEGGWCGPPSSPESEKAKSDDP